MLDVIIPFPAAAKPIIADSALLPTVLVNLIIDYATELDFSLLMKVDLAFNEMGEVTNPGIRALLKEAFMSSCCSPLLKTELMEREYLDHVPEQEERDFRIRGEIALIFQEIADSGGCIMFDHVELACMQLTGFVWTGISLRYANLADIRLVDIDMRHADLTGASIIGGEWVGVDIDGANLSGIDLNELDVCTLVGLTNPTGLIATGAANESDLITIDGDADMLAQDNSDIESGLITIDTDMPEQLASDDESDLIPIDASTLDDDYN